jgi:hypothetical protein
MRYDMSSTNGVRSMPVALHHVLDKRAHTCAYSTPPQIEREEWLGGSRYLTPPQMAEEESSGNARGRAPSLPQGSTSM